MVWPTLGSRTAKKQNRTDGHESVAPFLAHPAEYIGPK